MSITYASIVITSSSLSTDFGLQLAMKKLGMTEEQLAEKLGRYSRGKRKGKIKGSLQWLKVEKAGWVKMGRYDWDSMQADGFVCRFAGLTYNYQVVDGWHTDEVLIPSPEDPKMELQRLCRQKQDSLREKKEATNESA
jgi:hypothetical protein